MANPDGLLVIPEGVVAPLKPDPTIAGLHRYAAVGGKLFDHTPSPADILQGAVGDCFLLAALSAILNRAGGPGVIQEMMRDNKDGTVSFRMWGKDGRAEYFRIKKSIVWRFGSAKHSRGAGWVSLTEKAYAAFALGGDYSQLDHGGQGEDAMQAIIGKAAPILAGDAVLSRLIDLSPAAPGRGIEKANDLAFVTSAIFPDDAPANTHAELWYQWNKADKRNALLAIFDSTLNYVKFEAELNKMGAGLDRDTRERILAWAKDSSTLTWRDPFGKYTPAQLDFFAKVHRLLATQHAVEVATRQKLPGVLEGRGHSANEDMVAGLVGNHAYALAATRVDEGGLRFLLVRNPWGDYGRQYKTQTGQPGLIPVAAPKQAESWIELADFFRNFVQFTQSGPVLTQAQTNFRTNLAQQLQDQRLLLRKTVINPCPHPNCKCAMFVANRWKPTLCGVCQHPHHRS